MTGKTTMSTAVRALVLGVVLLAGQAGAFYSPTQGRWISRDPAAESSSQPLYIAMANAPQGVLDYLGLFEVGPAPGDHPPESRPPPIVYPKPREGGDIAEIVSPVPDCRERCLNWIGAFFRRLKARYLKEYESCSEKTDLIGAVGESCPRRVGSYVEIGAEVLDKGCEAVYRQNVREAERMQQDGEAKCNKLPPCTPAGPVQPLPGFGNPPIATIPASP